MGLRPLDHVADRLFGPLLEAEDLHRGWRVTSWDVEQGLSLVLADAQRERFVLVELEPRDDTLQCYARTGRFNVNARPQFTASAELSPVERKLVEAVTHLVRRREGLVVIDDGPASTKSQVREIEVARMLIPEGKDRYYLNAYAGCMIGCSFCYVGPRAELSRRLEGVPPPAWGRWVDVKVNAAEVLRAEIGRLPPGAVRMSPILTDPYQPLEKRYRITRQCLELLVPAGFRPVILTRQSRVLEDLPLLAGGPAAVGFSIPTDDDRLRRAFEPRADSIESRFDALARVKAAGLTTYVVVQPALPMDVAKFVARVAPYADVVRVDRMHFGDRVREQYAAAGISDAATDAAQDTLITALRDAFSGAGVPVDADEDLAGALDRLMSR